MSQLPEFLKRTRPRRVADAAVQPPVANPVNEPTADVGANSTPPMTRPRTVNAPAPPLPAPPPTSDQTATSAGLPSATRPRVVAPAARRAADLAQERDTLLKQRNPKATHSGWYAALKEAGLGLLTGGIPGAVGGAIHGAVAPNILDRQKRDAEAARLLGEEQIARGRAGAAAEQSYKAAQTRRANAATAYDEARPELEATKQKAAALHREQNAVLANLRLLKGQKLDPTNAVHARLLQRAADAGVEVSPDEWNDERANSVSFDVIDPDNPTRKERVTYNRVTHEATPVQVDGQPAHTGYVAPIHPATEMTKSQEAGVTDRRAGQAETRRHNVESEQQGQTRIQQGDEHIAISRDNATHRGEPTAAHSDARLARAAELNRKLEEEKNKAAHPPHMINGVETTDAYRRGYTERHKQAAAGFAEQIRSAYGDLYEVGADGDGWHYAKSRIPPGAGTRGGAATYSEDDVRQRARAAGRDENAAVEAARKAGLIHR